MSRPARGAGSRRWRPGRRGAAARSRSSANTRSVPSSASTDIAAVMSATRSSRARSWRARISMPSIPSVPLISASPSFGPSVSGSMPATSPSITSPSPISTSAQWASGARSPLAPSEPNSGTRGVIPALSSARIASATSGRAPEQPIASVRARSSIIARTTSALDRRPHAGGVRAHERALELLAALDRDRHVGERAEAGGDAVGGLGAVGEAVDDGGARLHRRPRLRGQAHLRAGRARRRRRRPARVRCR